MALARVAVDGVVGCVTIGLRPEHLALCDKGAAEALAGRVVHRENLGADIYLHVAVLDGAQRLVVRVPPLEGAAISIGDTCHVRRLHGQAMVFGKDGRRLDLSRAGRDVAEVA